MLATQIEVSDGTLNIVNVGIEFFEQDDISVSLDQSEPLILGVDYLWSAATTIQFLNSANTPGGLVPAGVQVLIRRGTESDAMFNIYDGGAPFSRLTLDENFEQLLFLSQEYKEGLGLDGLKSNLNMNGFRIVNVGDPIAPGDAANKEYVDALNGKTVRTPENIPALPSAGTRANKVMGFDALGNPVAVLPATGSGTELALDLLNTVEANKGMGLIPSGDRLVATVAEALALTGWAIGMRVRTQGYFAAGDGGSNYYQVVAAGTGTHDGGSFINLPGGLYQLKGLFIDGGVRVDQWGVRADWNGTTGTDNSPAFQRAFAFAFATKHYEVTLLQQPGRMAVGSYMNVPSGVSFVSHEMDLVPLNTFAGSNGYMFGMASANASSEDVGAIRSRLTEIRGLRLYNELSLAVKGIFMAATKGAVKDMFSFRMHQTIQRDDSYIDQCDIDTVNISEPLGTLYHIDMSSSGDGLRITNSHLYNYTPGVSNLNHINVRLSAGAKISRIINGNINLSRCIATSIENAHIEAGSITIDNSLYSIRDTYIWNNLLFNSGDITITNTVNNQKNIGNLENVTFIYSNQFAYNADFFDVRLPAGMGTLNIKGCCRAFVDINATGNRVLSGIRISQDGVQFDRFNRWSHALSNECQIQHDIATPFTIRQLGASETLSAVSTSTVVPWRAATGTYYYRAVALLDSLRRVGRVDTNEFSGAFTNGGSGARLTVGYSESVGMLVRFYRGTSPNSYDMSVDVPIIDVGEGVKDDGVSINGYSWLPRTAGPSITVDTASSLALSGLLSTTRVTAVPTTGTYNAGDRAIRTPPIVGQPKAWSWTGSAWVSEGVL